MIIDGKDLANKIKGNIEQEITFNYCTGGCTLSVVSIGDDDASKVYVRNKKKSAEEVGMSFIHEVIGQDEPLEYVKERITKLVNNSDGIIVQLPIHTTQNYTINDLQPLIPDRLDVDGFGEHSQSGLFDNYLKHPEYHYPCTPLGIIKLIECAGVTLAGKKAVVFGRSNIVGKPIANMLLANDCQVTICHSKSSDESMADALAQADIVISAVGKTKFLDKIIELAKTKNPSLHFEVIIDVAMNRDENGKLCGDISEQIKDEYADNYTPVPGGVGPMTVAMLIQNTWDSYRRRNNI